MGKQLMSTLAVEPYEVTVYRTVENDKDAAVHPQSLLFQQAVLQMRFKNSDTFPSLF